MIFGTYSYVTERKLRNQQFMKGRKVGLGSEPEIDQQSIESLNPSMSVKWNCPMMVKTPGEHNMCSRKY